MNPVRNSDMHKKVKKTKISNRVKRALRILIAAGPTIEPIDPVRFISNRSTGRMGYELAREAAKKGCRVTLISGPTNITPPKGIKVIHIETALELRKEILRELEKSDVLLMPSAVSDFRPASFSKVKIESGRPFTLRLTRNADILASIPAVKRKNKILAGFCLETGNLLKSAARKLKNKKLDLIVANRITISASPFGAGAKTVYLLDKYGRVKKLKKMTKTRIACAILDTVEELCYTSN